MQIPSLVHFRRGNESLVCRACCVLVVVGLSSMVHSNPKYMLVLFVSVQPDPKVFADAINLLTFYLYNNTTLQGADRVKVKSFLFQFLHEFFFLPR